MIRKSTHVTESKKRFIITTAILHLDCPDYTIVARTTTATSTPSTTNPITITTIVIVIISSRIRNGNSNKTTACQVNL